MVLRVGVWDWRTTIVRCCVLGRVEVWGLWLGVDLDVFLVAVVRLLACPSHNIYTTPNVLDTWYLPRNPEQPNTAFLPATLTSVKGVSAC